MANIQIVRLRKHDIFEQLKLRVRIHAKNKTVEFNKKQVSLVPSYFIEIKMIYTYEKNFRIVKRLIFLLLTLIKLPIL